MIEHFPRILPDAELASWRERFDRAQARAMSDESLTLRFLALTLASRGNMPVTPRERVAVYAMVEDAEPYPQAVAALEADPSMNSSDFLKLLPPKYSLGVTSSMSAAQVAMELGAHGPIHCVLPGPRSFSFLLDQIQLDHRSGDMERGVFLIATPQDRVFLHSRNTPGTMVSFFGAPENEVLKALERDVASFCVRTGLQLD